MVVQIVTVGTMVVVAFVVVAHRIDYFVAENFVVGNFVVKNFVVENFVVTVEEIAEMIALEFVAVLEFQHLVGRLIRLPYKNTT